MKTLFIIRHAKAEWRSENGSDFSRALCSTGVNEVKFIGNQLLHKNVVIDAIVFSSALRTMQTAQQIANICGIEEFNMYAEPLLYLADADNIETIVTEFADDKNNMAVVCHNPGITEFAHSLVPNKFSDSMPTCAVVAVKGNTENWSDFAKSKKELLFVLSPEEFVNNHTSDFSK
jgi:phosphohistidine phosphatase